MFRLSIRSFLDPLNEPIVCLSANLGTVYLLGVLTNSVGDLGVILTKLRSVFFLFFLIGEVVGFCDDVRVFETFSDTSPFIS